MTGPDGSSKARHHSSPNPVPGIAPADRADASAVLQSVWVGEFRSGVTTDVKSPRRGDLAFKRPFDFNSAIAPWLFPCGKTPTSVGY